MQKVPPYFLISVVFCFFCSVQTNLAYSARHTGQRYIPDVWQAAKKENIRSIAIQHSDGVSLSLNEAILLAVRSNPNVQSSQLGLIAQKFSLWVQEWEFNPHYSFLASAVEYRNGSRHNSTASHNVNATPGISILTPIGTTVALNASNNDTGHYNPGLSLQIAQPLMRGFGTAIVEASLNNARDSLQISRLSIEGVLRATVTDVINAYLDIVSAERTIVIDEDTVKRAETSVHQTRLFIKAGHKAGNELVTVEANVASAKTKLENDKNNLDQARYALLAAIGIDPNTQINFTDLDVNGLIAKYHLPSMAQTKKLILENDIQYQTDDITLHGQRERDLMVAEDNTRWQLNFSANAVTGNSTGGGRNAGWHSIYNGINENQNVGLALTIPIDDQIAKQAVVSAKIALKQAELALLQEKWNKETSAINGWNNVRSAERALSFAQDAEKLQEKTYHVSYQKYIHGLIDSLELQSALQSLVQSQQDLLSARISYLKALVNLDLLIGNTLRTWDVRVRL